MKPVPRGSVPARSRKPRSASGWAISPKVRRRSRSWNDGLLRRSMAIAPPSHSTLSNARLRRIVSWPMPCAPNTAPASADSTPPVGQPVASACASASGVASAIEQARHGAWTAAPRAPASVELAFLLRGVLRAASLVLDRIENAGLLRLEGGERGLACGEVRRHRHYSAAFPIAQRGAEDRVAGGLAFAGVGHREQVQRHRPDELVVAAHVDQSLRGHRQRRQRRAGDQRHRRLHEGLRLAHCIAQQGRQRIGRIGQRIERLGQRLGVGPVVRGATGTRSSAPVMPTPGTPAVRTAVSTADSPRCRCRSLKSDAPAGRSLAEIRNRQKPAHRQGGSPREREPGVAWRVAVVVGTHARCGSADAVPEWRAATAARLPAWKATATGWPVAACTLAPVAKPSTTQTTRSAGLRQSSPISPIRQ